MQTNTAVRHQVRTAGGAPAFPHIKPIDQLRRSVLSCLLWESEFYQDGKAIADQTAEAAAGVAPEQLAAVAVEARSVHNLRHVPLLLCALLAKRGGKIVGDTIAQVIQRADELPEFLSVYWSINPAVKAGAKHAPLSKQVKRGLALAFGKFDEYALAKYDREKAVKLRDVMFLAHPKPRDEAQADLWKRLAADELKAPDTWEVALSAGQDKCAAWTRLLKEGQLGYLAVLRNLRNMTKVGVDAALIREAILARKGAKRVLPFRYIAAARACPQLEPAIDEALAEAIADLPVLPGRTVVLVDVSGSMDHPLSAKSDLKRVDAAAALASIIHGDVRMFSFSTELVEVPPRRGMAGVDALLKSQRHGGTDLAGAVLAIHRSVPHDRLIVVTDEQATTGGIPQPMAAKAYMINVASNRNGVGYGRWNHIDGFSEGVLRFLHEVERVAEPTH